MIQHFRALSFNLNLYLELEIPPHNLILRLGIYWKFTWGVFIPLSLMGIFIYSLANFRTFVTEGYIYPASLTGSGWVLAALALLQVPIWAGLAIYKRKGSLLDVSLFRFHLFV